MSIQDGGSSPNTFITSTDCADLSFNEHGITVDNGMFVFETFEDFDQTLSIINNMNIEDYAVWASNYSVTSIYLDYYQAGNDLNLFYNSVLENNPEIDETSANVLLNEWIQSNEYRVNYSKEGVKARIQDSDLEGILNREGRFRICNTEIIIDDKSIYSFNVKNPLQYDSSIKQVSYKSETEPFSYSGRYGCQREKFLDGSESRKIVGTFEAFMTSFTIWTASGESVVKKYRFAQIAKNRPKKKCGFNQIFCYFKSDKRHVGLEVSSHGENRIIGNIAPGMNSHITSYDAHYFYDCQFTKEIKRIYGVSHFETTSNPSANEIDMEVYYDRHWMQYTNRDGNCSSIDAKINDRLEDCGEECFPNPGNGHCFKDDIHYGDFH